MLLHFLLFFSVAWLTQAAPSQAPPGEGGAKPMEKSSWFAFVDREYIFTCEVTRPGEVLFNFVSMTDKEESLAAKLVRLTFDNRRVPATFFVIETGNQFFLSVTERNDW